jgi:hypothetical protein
MQAKCRRDKIDLESARPRCREPGALPLSSPLPMSHKHDNLIRAIFHDPVSGNLQWREIESLLRHLGATIESLSGTRIRVKLNGAEGILHRPHGGNSLGRQDIQHLREYLSHARVTPSLYEADRKP